MRTILSEALTAAVARLCVQANTQLPADVTAALNRCRQLYHKPFDPLQAVGGLKHGQPAHVF